MNLITSIVVGVVVGFAASAMRTADGREDLIRSIFLGMGGAYVGIWLARSLFESAESGSLNIALVAGSISGAAILLFVVNRVSKT